MIIARLNEELLDRVHYINENESIKQEHKQKLCLEVVYNLMYGVVNNMIADLEEVEEHLNRRGLTSRELDIAVEAIYNYTDDYVGNSTDNRTLLTYYRDLGINL